MIPTKCTECGEIKELFYVTIHEKGRLYCFFGPFPKWVCYDCWRSGV